MTKYIEKPYHFALFYTIYLGGLMSLYCMESYTEGNMKSPLIHLFRRLGWTPHFSHHWPFLSWS